MMFAKGMHPGAIWKRTDLQIHTPRDPQWQGSAHLIGGTPDAESARDNWADGFVAQCIANGLGAIAITDHHDACFVPYVAAAIDRLPAGTSHLWLFPGMEVTCRDAVQCLILFDQGTPFETLRRLFGGHLNIAEPGLDAATNPQAVECGQAIEDFFKNVARDPVLTDVSIILPHAGEGGHKTMLRNGFAPRFASLPFDGVYLDHEFGRLSDGAKRKIQGETQEWGRRRRGILPTGDNRSQNFARLGSRECWVRLGEPTVESIRQALLADEARIAYERPALPSQRILELRINSTLTGPDFRLSFNDGFTAIIGGRGSGKSAILEYLRFGLGRSAGDVVSGEETYRERDQELITQTLANGTVSVMLERDGVVETWTRSGQQRDAITVQVEGGDTLPLSIPDAQQRFRARAFYQKQLSTIVLDRDRTSEQITGIAAAELADQRRSVEREIAAAKRELSVAYQNIVEFWVAEAEHRNSVTKVADLRARLDAIRGRMGAAGLSEDHQTLLRAAPDYSLAGKLIEEARQQLDADRATLTAVGPRLTSTKTDQWVPLCERFPDFAKVIELSKNAEFGVKAALDQAIAALEDYRIQREVVFSLIIQDIGAFETQHAEAVTLQENGRALVDEARRLSEDLQTALTDERKTAARLDLLQEAPVKLVDARAALDAKLGQFRRLLEQAAINVEPMSSGALRARVQLERAPKQHFEALRSICNGSRIRDLDTKCEDRVAQIAAGAVDHTWSALVDAVLEVRKYKLQTGAPNIDLGDRIGRVVADALLGELTPQQLNGVYNRIEDSSAVELLTATADDYIVFEYRDAGAYIPFGQASPGQQASALLQLLLVQEAGTLIIDQPEDDLDNRVIMDIAKLLQRTKRRRQLLFATHNPNFVVNGDADKIVALTAGNAEQGPDQAGVPRIDIKTDGAIETSTVRNAVTETMEGGQTAFELRSRKYSFIAS